MVIAFASRNLRLSQPRYCTTRREMLAAVVMCSHFRSYLWGAQFTLRTDYSSLRWLQKFRNGDGMLAHWYILLGQFSVTFEYHPGAQHANADGMSGQCGQCQRPDCPVSSLIRGFLIWTPRRFYWISRSPRRRWATPWTRICCRSCMGKSGWQLRYWKDLPPAGSDIDLIVASRQDVTLTTVREWVQSGAIPAWSECSGLSPELRCWWLQIGNLSVDTEWRLWRRRAPPSGASQLVVPGRERQDMIRRFHD